MSQSIRGFNAVAVVLLAFAIVAAFLSFRAGEAASGPHGPQALAVGGGKVWIADGESLLVSDRDGHVLQEYPFAKLGVESIGSINAVDDERMLIATRGNLTLRLLDGEGRLLRTIPLHFPGGLDKQASHTLWFAGTPVDGEGHFRIAVATGGNHAVALFDDEGRFLAQTAEHLYRYTNGIWYANEGWWTTDTNRYILRRLALNTLEQTEQIRLDRDNAQRYLGAAVASRGAPGKLGQPLGTVFRLQAGMTVGRVVDVFSDGREIEYPLPVNAEPMDMVWLGNELLVADGRSTTIQRFNAAREALGEFGDFSLRQRFRKTAERRAAAEEWHMNWLYGASGCLIAALICVVLARRTPKELREAHPALPVPGWRTQLRLAAPSIVASVAFLGFAAVLGVYAAPLIEWAKHQHVFPPAILIAVMQIAMVSPFIAFLVWSIRQARRKSKLPEFEPLYNLGALVWLNDNRMWRELCWEGEHPVEVIQTFVPDFGYLLLTNQRLLHFRQGSSPQPDAAWERANVLSAEFSEDAPTAIRKWGSGKWVAFAYLTIDTGEGGAVIYRVISRCTAARICAQLGGSPIDTPIALREQQRTGEFSKPWMQILCAALVPGLGQWMQRRNTAALIFFLIAAAVFTFMIFPLAMVLISGSADVCPSIERKYAFAWGYLSLAASIDAWLMAGRDIQR